MLPAGRRRRSGVVTGGCRGVGASPPSILLYYKVALRGCFFAHRGGLFVVSYGFLPGGWRAAILSGSCKAPFGCGWMDGHAAGAILTVSYTGSFQTQREETIRLRGRSRGLRRMLPARRSPSRAARWQRWCSWQGGRGTASGCQRSRRGSGQSSPAGTGRE